MALFSFEDHAKHPPSTWTVRKHGRKWGLCLTSPDQDFPSQTYNTKREAEAAKVSGFYVDLYAKEGRWYAGEHVQGWKPWALCKAEQEALAARWSQAVG